MILHQNQGQNYRLSVKMTSDIEFFVKFLIDQFEVGFFQAENLFFHSLVINLQKINKIFKNFCGVFLQTEYFRRIVTQ